MIKLGDLYGHFGLDPKDDPRSTSLVISIARTNDPWSVDAEIRVSEAIRRCFIHRTIGQRIRDFFE